MLGTNEIMSALAEAPAETTDRKPLLRITKSGPIITGSDTDFELQRKNYEQRHWLLLRNFLDQALLELIQEKLAETEFCVIDRETGVEMRPIDCTSYLATELLLNTPQLFRAIEQLTGCERIACFSGRIYRRLPNSDYFNRWHTDITDEGRLIALSINLSEQPYTGGALQIRSSKSHEVLCEVHNSGYGDALIFPVNERFEHRVGRVDGDTAKTALAGWFRSKYDPNSLFGRGRSVSPV